MVKDQEEDFGISLLDIFPLILTMNSFLNTEQIILTLIIQDMILGILTF